MNSYTTVEESLVTFVHRSITCIHIHVLFSLNSRLQASCQHGYCPSYVTFWMQYALLHWKLLVRDDGLRVQRDVENVCVSQVQSASVQVFYNRFIIRQNISLLEKNTVLLYQAVTMFRLPVI